MLYEAYPCVWLGKTERWELLEKMRESFSFYGVIREEGRALAERPEASVITRKLEQPDRKLKQQMTEELLGDLADRLPEDISLAHLAGRQLPMGDYLRYLKTIRTELLADSFHEQTWNLPSDSLHLQLLTGNRRFSELKLPKPQYEQLRRICRMVEAREEVMEQWGFGRKFSYGNGISVLFYGAPGTGKTMAAQVLATELGRPLYRVDLSQLISKYIGETQKNIGKVFDEADRCDCILLFDEADAIFTRRSDVSDAQDRYSNAETAYLLQRIEQYAGISVLATNLLQNFDEAFRRRISYMVHFPMPDASLRKELWEEIFPVDTPVDPEVDTCMLAQAFEISGAAIKNAAMHGALEAASEHSPVKMKHLLAGIQNEYSKQGRNFSAAQKELLEAIAGLQPTESGASIEYYAPEASAPVQLIGKSPKAIREAGIHLSFVPEDRLGMGLVGSMGMTDNMMLKSYGKGHSPIVDRKAPLALAETIKKELGVVTPDLNTPVSRLSGGNVQKVLVGRELAADPIVLMTAYAVRGLDINTSYTIYHLLNEQKKRGVAVIYVGEDLDVLLELCDRIVVLCGGKVNGILDGRKTTKEEVGLRMTNLVKEEQA